MLSEHKCCNSYAVYTIWCESCSHMPLAKLVLIETLSSVSSYFTFSTVCTNLVVYLCQMLISSMLTLYLYRIAGSFESLLSRHLPPM